MYRYLKPIAVALLGSSLLTGCFTQLTTSNTKKPTVKDVAILTDNIIALGKPKTPLAQYPYAMAMVGNKNDYLVTSAESDKAILQKIFSQLDSKSLHLLGAHEVKDKPEAIYEHFFSDITRVRFKVNPDIHHKSQAQKSLTTGVSTKTIIAFFKPAKDVSSKEKSTLTSLGFDCISDTMQIYNWIAMRGIASDDPTLYTFCQRPTQVTLIPVQKTTNNAQLPHKLKRPLSIEVSYSTAKTIGTKGALANAGTVLMTPLAIAMDVITFPAQLFVCSGACVLEP